ncbi:MAG TPA: hypothetical protein QGF35_07055 [Dehalococcoidia bacterium]|nr:hypothetical protein [Dehalococcoidia bacterium]
MFFSGVAIHAFWNFLAYVNYGDVFLAERAPDASWLDVFSISLMVVLTIACFVLIVGLARNLRDETPAPVYEALGMISTPRAEDISGTALSSGTGEAAGPAVG